jgi:Flp pilus assembly protein TadG
MRMRGHGHWRKDEGSSLVEFSLIAFTFIILLLSVVEMGRMVLVYATVANSARAGARYAIVHGLERTGTGINGGPSGPGSYANVTTVVQNFASAGLLNTALLTVTVSYPDSTLNAAGSRVIVQVSYPYDPLVAYFNSTLSITMGSTSEGVITY